MIDIQNLQYSHIIFNKQFNDITLEQLEIERDFINACLETNIILEAEVSKVNGVKAKFEQLMKSIMEFFKKVMDSFIKNNKALIELNKKWLNDNMNKFDNLNYDGLQIKDIIPFWLTSSSDVNKVLDDFNGLVDPTSGIFRKPKKPTSREEVENLDIIKKYKTDGMDLKNGLEKYFKVGNGKLDPITIDSGKLKDLCTNTIKLYIAEYHDGMINTLQARVSKIESQMKKVLNHLSTREPLGETFCMLENSYYKDTYLRYCNNYDILYEAEQSTPNDDKSDNKKPTVIDTKEDDYKYSNTSTEELTYMRHVLQINQLAIGTAMNVFEEKYKVYMNILKQVLAARKPQKIKDEPKKKK